MTFFLGLAKRFGLTPEQFAENLRDGYQRHEVDQYPGDPIECASEFGNSRFADPKDALRAAKYMVAMQLAREPLVSLSFSIIRIVEIDHLIQPSR